MPLAPMDRLRQALRRHASETASSAPASSRPRVPRPRRGRGWWMAGCVVVVVWVLIRFVASPLAESVVNRKLAALPGYSGEVGAIKLALWRGSAEVNDLVLRERGHEAEPAVVTVRKAVLTLSPRALITGKLGGTALVDGAEINLVKRERVEDPKEEAADAATKVKEQAEQVARWQDTFRDSFPMTLARLEVRNTRVHFLDRTHQPNVDVAIDNLHIVATGLQNRPAADGDALPAKLEVSGVTTGGGKLRLSVQVDPLGRPPRFHGKMELREQSLPPFNSFLLAYADADVSRGTFEVFMEVDAREGRYAGYVKPLFHDLDFRTASDEGKNVAEKLKETVVAAVTSVLRNEEEQQVATKAPFAGNFADNEVDIWTTIVNLFRNAFVQALRGGLEGETPRA